MIIGPNQQVFSIIGKLQTCPGPTSGGWRITLLVRGEVKCRKGRLIVVTEVVKQNGGRGLGCNGDHGRGWVEGDQIWCRQLQLSLRIPRVEIPERDSVVLGTGYKSIAAGRKR